MKIKITLYPRIHVDLINMNPNAYRVNGGFGFSVNSPTIEIICHESDSFQIEDTYNCFTQIQRDKLSKVINECVRKKKLSKNISINILNRIYPQSGFGTTTSIRLGCIEALMIINKQDYSISDIVELSQRGGTSGIGVRTYFNGGFVFDIGHKNKRTIHSSDYNESNPLQTLLIENSYMPDWEIGICIPSYLNTLTIEQEELFFKNNSNIALEDIYETLYLIVNGLYAGVKEKDKARFCDAINTIQKIGWKKNERKLYGQELLEIEEELFSCGANAVGMSSLGPSLFFLSENINTVKECFVNRSKKDVLFFLSKVCNNGRLIEIC